MKSNASKRKNTIWDRQSDLFQRLIDNPDFQTQIAATRKKWGIPAGGYKKHGPQWERKLGRLDDKYYATQWPSDREEVNQAEQKALKLEIKWPDFEALKQEVHYRRPINGFFHDIDLIIADFHVSPLWKQSLKLLIVFGQTNLYGVSVGISFSIPIRDFPDVIEITIDAHTTLQDMTERWPDIERAQKQLKHASYEKYQPYPSYNLHKRLYDLRESGMSLKDISAQTGVPYSYIGTYIKRYLQHIDNNK